MKKGPILVYVPGNSILHHWDPRLKIIACVLVSFAVLVNDRLAYSLVNAAVLFLCFPVAGYRPGRLLRRLQPLFLLFFLTLLFSIFLIKGDVFFQIYGLKASVQGFYLGLSSVLRLTTIFLSFTLLTLTTPPLQLIAGMQWLFSPLSFFMVPVDLMALLICVSLRFIPVIIKEAEDIRTAQMSRGAPIHSRNLFIRLKSVLSLLIPLLASSLQRADDLAQAMESRCVSQESSVKMYKTLRMSKADILCAFFMLCDTILFFSVL